jgi:hypothetical protein
MRHNPNNGGHVGPDVSPDHYCQVVNLLDLMKMPGSGYQWLYIFVGSAWALALRRAERDMADARGEYSTLTNPAPEIKHRDEKEPELSPEQRAALEIAKEAARTKRIAELEPIMPRLAERVRDIAVKAPQYDPATPPDEELLKRVDDPMWKQVDAIYKAP